MFNLLRLFVILSIECSAAIISGKNPFLLYKRMVSVFNMKQRRSDSLTDLEQAYCVFLIILMAENNPQIKLKCIGDNINMENDIFKNNINKCKDLGLIEILDETDDQLMSEYIINHKKHQFSVLRNNYIHSAEKFPELTAGIYKMLRHVYYVTQCNPAWTFISLKGDKWFKEMIPMICQFGCVKGFHTRRISEQK